MAKRQQKLSVKVPERLLAGVYANQMIVRHTREEFLIDFVNRFPPTGVVTARVIVSPGHLKRMVRALEDNVRRYEATYGPIIDVTAMPAGPRQEQTSGASPPEGGGEDPPAGAGPAGQQRPGVAESPARRRRPEVRAKVPESVVAGVYANQMVVSHSREEFLIDFVNIFPPDGVVTSRVFVSPEQLKRMIRALDDNFARYEAAHGTISEASVPQVDAFLN